MSGLALLHTAASHVPKFGTLASEFAPGVPLTHAVHEQLLEEAKVRGGVDEVLAAELKALLETLAREAEVILCTCSTLGAAAERFDGQFGARVVRVDRPLARAAVMQGERIAVVVALQSTLEPTQKLLEEEAFRAGKDVKLETVFVPKAWEYFERGERERYGQVLAEAADEAAARADVIVLAQASMAGAERYAKTDKPVLSSPVLGVKAALEVLTSLVPHQRCQ